MRSNVYAVCAPPILVTMLLMWRVNAYKRVNHTYTVSDMELLSESETAFYRFKSSDSRRMNQGVLVALMSDETEQTSPEEPFRDVDLAALNESDIDELDESELEDVLCGACEQTLVAYMIYGKQKDEHETVAIRELCVHGDYRRRRVAKCFLKKASRLLRDLGGYRRFAFQASSFDTDLTRICEAKSSVITKIYTWVAYQFLPGVFDYRTVYSIDFNQLKNI